MPRSGSGPMRERISVNTGPLVALAKADALEVIGQLPFDFICPPAVRRELDEGAKLGHPAVLAPWLAVTPLARPIDPVAVTILDAGEAAVIQLALDEGLRRVCIDERRGRQIARAVGLDVMGSLGLLLRAKSEGLIDELRPYIDRLQAAGIWYDRHLIQRVLAAAGE